MRLISAGCRERSVTDSGISDHPLLLLINGAVGKLASNDGLSLFTQTQCG